MANPGQLLRHKAKATKFDNSPGANTDIISDLTLSDDHAVGIFRVHIVVESATGFNVQRTRSGTTKSEDLNEGNNLAANAIYNFDVVVHDADDAINFQIDTGVTISSLIVTEIGGGV